MAEDHQTRNAKALSDKEAAILLPDHIARVSLADEAIKLVSDEVIRKRLSENISKLAERDADKRIAEVVIRIAKE